MCFGISEKRVFPAQFGNLFADSWQSYFQFLESQGEFLERCFRIWRSLHRKPFKIWKVNTDLRIVNPNLKTLFSDKIERVAVKLSKVWKVNPDLWKAIWICRKCWWNLEFYCWTYVKIEPNWEIQFSDIKTSNPEIPSIVDFTWKVFPDLENSHSVLTVYYCVD